MQQLYAADFGMHPGGQIGKPLQAVFAKLRELPGEKTLLFEPGTYYIDRDDCRDEIYAITNTAGKKEHKDPAQINRHRVALHLKNISDLTVDGQGAVFVLDGKMTNCVISACKNVTLCNLTINTIQPNVHKLTVQKVTPFAAWFALDSASRYVQEGADYVFVGKGYRLGLLENANKAFWTAGIRPAQPNTVFRTAHPLCGARRVREVEPYLFKASYFAHPPMQVGQTFHVFDAKRDEVGIFIEKSENITLANIAQSFNYSLGVVAQDCVNLTLRELCMAPEKGDARQIASLADFLQICMCAGDVFITDCYFDGAADDALNVHGIHFKITKAAGKTITVKFCHEQSWGFNPLHAGDRIAFIDPQTLLSAGNATIVESELVDDYHIRLTLDTNTLPLGVGHVIEDVDRCPNVYFANNTVNRIITRGLLLTTRGKTVVENNRFLSTTMSGVLVSDDAKKLV